MREKTLPFQLRKATKQQTGKKGQLPKAKDEIITNPATNSSFEVIAQTKSANGFSATVFRNINTNEYTIAQQGILEFRIKFRNSVIGGGQSDRSNLQKF